MSSRCAVAALLGSGGPVRVSMRPCCVLALVGGEPPADPALREEFVCAGREALLPVGATASPGDEPAAEVAT
jgi:hypothetical protein